MKALIWILTVLIFNFLNTLLGAATGIKIGYLLIWPPIWFVASRLCRAWDKHKENGKRSVTTPQDMEHQSENSAGMTKTETVSPTPPPIKFCRKCGFKLLDGSDFCSRCGTEIVKERKDEMS